MFYYDPNMTHITTDMEAGISEDISDVEQLMMNYMPANSPYTSDKLFVELGWWWKGVCAIYPHKFPENGRIDVNWHIYIHTPMYIYTALLLKKSVAQGHV